ncbi:MAG: hypothetical protein N3G20_06175, partial [Verrucomicrobiae bacterium]|nr:hypothetical protein [Verrucomicrobiae bacterium]
DVYKRQETTYAVLHSQLAAYTNMVTVFTNDQIHTNALTVIVSGNCPRNTMAAQSVRYAACDGREPDLDSDVTTALVPLISERWGKFFKWRGSGPIPDPELSLLNKLVEKAHGKGRLIRFWDTPDNPEGWSVLYDAGVDLLNTDKPAALRDFLLLRDRRLPSRSM